MPTQQQCNNQLLDLVNMNTHLLKPWSLRKSVIKLLPQLSWSCCTFSPFCEVRSAPSRCLAHITKAALHLPGAASYVWP
jgi:hypothetical protein